MALPGLTSYATIPLAPDFGSPTYSELVADALGNVGTDGDDLDVSTQALAALMAAYETEASDTINGEDIPDLQGVPFDLSIDDAMLASLAVADAAELGINLGLDFLFNTFGVWDALNQAVNAIYTTIGDAVSELQGEIASLVQIQIPPIQFPPTPCDPFFSPQDCPLDGF